MSRYRASVCNQVGYPTLQDIKFNENLVAFSRFETLLYEEKKDVDWTICVRIKLEQATAG